MPNPSLISLDAFSRTEEDVRVRTKTGALITIGCSIITLFLLLQQCLQFRKIETKPELVIDRERHMTLQLSLDVTFPQIPCDLITLDLMDAAGEIQLDIMSSGFSKTRLSNRGDELGSFEFDIDKELGEYPPASENYCGSCYGALDQTGNSEIEKISDKVCCQTCAQVREAYLEAGWSFFDGEGITQCEREGYVEKLNEHLLEGCRVQGYAQLNRIQGNIHFAPGYAFQNRRGHYHDTSLYDKKDTMNFNHIINHLSFGPHVNPGMESRFVTASISPLDGYQLRSKSKDSHDQQYIYFAKIVPTRYEYLDGEIAETAQFSTTTHSKSLKEEELTDRITHKESTSRVGTPGLYIYYEMSPLKVINREKYVQTWASLILNALTSMGGILAVGTVIDKIIYKAQRTIVHKKE